MLVLDLNHHLSHRAALRRPAWQPEEESRRRRSPQRGRRERESAAARDRHRCWITCVWFVL